MPAHLNGASVLTNRRSADYDPALPNVCWDLNGLGEKGCNGNRRKWASGWCGFVAARKLGALVWKTMNARLLFGNRSLKNIFWWNSNHEVEFLGT